MKLAITKNIALEVQESDNGMMIIVWQIIMDNYLLISTFMENDFKKIKQIYFILYSLMLWIIIYNCMLMKFFFNKTNDHCDSSVQIKR